jgi:hypothetical protein
MLLVLTLYFPQSFHRVVAEEKVRAILLMVAQAAVVTTNQLLLAQVQ